MCWAEELFFCGGAVMNSRTRVWVSCMPLWSQAEKCPGNMYADCGVRVERVGDAIEVILKPLFNEILSLCHIQFGTYFTPNAIYEFRIV